MTTTPTPDTFTDAVASMRPTEWDSIKPFAAELEERPVTSADALTQWLRDRSDFDAACSEGRATLYITMTRHTDDESAAGAWTKYLDEVQPNLQRASFQLDRRQHELAQEYKLDPNRYGVLLRDTAVDVELFRDENVPIETELGKLDQRYDALMGAMTVMFDGKERTMPEMSTFLEQTDRSVREAAWRGMAERRQQDRDEIHDIFETMVKQRDTLAHNAGFENYRDYMFQRRKRFDYTPQDCANFHDACEKHVVPLMRSMDRRRSRVMTVSPLRPWDLSVDPKGRPPLHPFENAAELTDKTCRLFDRMGAGLDEMFASLTEGVCLDLESRKGKAPGGYQYMRDASRTPFIFMNAAGLHGDVRTLIHEAGHAFHSMLCREEPLVHYRHSPIEFAEVASMSMELLTMDEWDVFYDNEEDLRRAKRDQLEGIISLLPWVATIDSFQHWIYLNPSHSRGARTEAWLDMFGRFTHEASWEGLDDTREIIWQRQGHLFGVPFYYIEYGIAQLGALQLWLMSKEKGLPAALDAYKAALSIGGAQPLPKLFEAAGIEFDFGSAIVERLVDALHTELEQLATS